ncbi:ParB/RepB/Spo0J family partition protein [Arthrobacter sp. NamB2]|nr:ParB/RepB/Spo0J family partition protein [Arthrobacter sp. NamB2]TKV29001.1 ParB/RepB/Spo0J family partition protein [Arthrobacter sp. NamB2]
MAEKRRGLGRGLGALIPSAPAEDVSETAEVLPAEEDQPKSVGGGPDDSRKPVGRPVDLFFERVTEDDVAEQPRSYSTALRNGINKNVTAAQSKRAATRGTRKTAGADGGEAPSTPRSTNNAVVGKGASGTAASVPAMDSPGLTGDDGRVVEPDTTVAHPDASVTDGDTSAAAHGGTPKGDPSGSTVESDQDNAVSRETTTAEPRPPLDSVPRGDQAALVDVPGATFADLPLDSIHPNRKQPRVEFNEDELAELVHSIREIGVLQPIVVRPSQEGGDAKYELVMGERRWRASREAGMENVPAIIRSTLDDDLLRDALLENLHRSALNPLEEAAAYQQLLEDFGCSHDELAGRLGRSRPQISNTLRLMKLPPLVQRRVAAGVLSAGHARALLGLGEPAEMEKLAQRIVSEGLSVRSTEEIVALSGGLRRASKPSAPRDGARHERLDYLATSLSDRLDTNVKITLGAKKGRVSIEFASVDDLNRIVGVLSPTSE